MRPLLPLTIVACVAVALGWLALSKPASQTPPRSPASQVQAQAQPASAAAVAMTPTAGGVDWNTLTSEQRDALHPLLNLWPTLRPEHQRKWIALAHNFNHMRPDEQFTLQGRMGEWARLTPAQRTQARLNFGEVRRVPADKRRAKWEEYQALPANERERLAKDRPKPPVSAAPALRPTPADRIVRRPADRRGRPPAALAASSPNAMTASSAAPAVPIDPASPLPPASTPSW